jgi:hypothetical protein
MDTGSDPGRTCVGGSPSGTWRADHDECARRGYGGCATPIDPDAGATGSTSSMASCTPITPCPAVGTGTYFPGTRARAIPSCTTGSAISSCTSITTGTSITGLDGRI